MEINVRNIGKWLFNPWSVYVTDIGEAQPAQPSFFTERGIGINPVIEFAEAFGYRPCSGVNYKVRKDALSFGLICTWSIKEFVPETVQLAYGGTIDSSGTTLTFDGTPAPLKKTILETCYTDDGKIVRLTIPKGRGTEPAAFETGDTHLLIPTTFEALPEIDDDSTLPTLYFEP